MKNFFRKNWAYVVLLLIVIFAATIRLYHFQIWLHFQLDQARDAMVVKKAVQEGFSNLPLLGPRAGGTFLRLGPAFYYLQYLSAKTTGSLEPYVLAYPDLIFNILAIPLFYFFLRLHFKKTSSLLGTALYAFSFIAVQHSRFAWNPNSVPFWTLLFLFSLVKFSQLENEKGKYLWLTAGALALGIVSQLHFLALLSLPIIAFLFLVWSKAYRKLNFKSVALIFLILAVLYTPVILSEIETGGSNTYQFASAIGSKPSDHSLSQKIFKTAEEHSRHYIFILTSYTFESKKGLSAVGAMFVAASLLLICVKFRDEKENSRKSFLKMVFVWFAVSYLIIFPFAFQTSPRFFLTVYFLPFIFFIFWIEDLLDYFERKKYQAVGIIISILITASILTLNMEAVRAGFRSAALDREPEFWKDRSFISSEIEKIPLYQLQSAADYIAERSWKENKKVHLGGNMTYRASLQYLLKLKNPAVDFENMSRSDDEVDELYFSVFDGLKGCSERTKDLLGSEIIDAHFFGHSFGLCELRLLPNFETMRPKKKAKEKKSSEENLNADIEDRARDRVFWKDIFGR